MVVAHRRDELRVLQTPAYSRSCRSALSSRLVQLDVDLAPPVFTNAMTKILVSGRPMYSQPEWKEARPSTCCLRGHVAVTLTVASAHRQPKPIDHLVRHVCLSRGTHLIKFMGDVLHGAHSHRYTCITDIHTTSIYMYRYCGSLVLAVCATWRTSCMFGWFCVHRPEVPSSSLRSQPRRAECNVYGHERAESAIHLGFTNADGYKSDQAPAPGVRATSAG